MHKKEVKVKSSFVLDTVSTINRIATYFAFQTGTLVSVKERTINSHVKTININQH